MPQGSKTPPQAAAEADLYFGPFRLENSKRLWQGKELVNVRPRTLAVLRYLSERSGQLVTGEELLKQLWPGIYVTKTVLRVCVRELRQALEDGHATPQFVETVGRQGYRFIAPISTTVPPVPGNQSSVVSADKEKTKLPQLRTHPQQPTTDNRQLTTPFVGREQELGRLHECFTRAQRGECQIMFLFGEPGIGKTTLVDRFLDQVREDGKVRIGHGQCVEHYGPGEAYLPLLEAFGQLYREPGGEQVLAVLRRHAPTWLAQMPGLLKAGDLEAVQRQGPGVNRERMLRELAEAIEAIAADAVLVLVLEDLQWADASTLDAIVYLAQRRQVRLYLVGTYRPTDVVVSGHPLRQVVQELYGRRQCEELALELFTEADVEEYLHQCFDRVADITGLSRMIYRRTDGNALFMVSFVDYLLQHELLIEADGQIQLGADPAAFRRIVPNSLQQAILRQIERLDPDEQQLLGITSVGGMVFTAAEVVGGTKRTLEEAEEVYDHLANRGLVITATEIVEWPDGTVAVQYRFRHALYQQVLYEQLGQGRRMRLHQQLGERKEAGYGERAGEIARELAMHFTEGRDYGRAVQYYSQAGETALRHSAYAEAITYCEEGLDLLERLPDTPERQRQELTLRMLLSSVLTATQGYGGDALVQNLSRARELCQALKDEATLVPVLVGLGRFYDMRADHDAIEHLADEELGLLKRVKDPALALQLHTHLGTSNLLRGALAQAQEHHARALEMYDPQQHRELMLHFGVNPAVAGSVLSGWSLWLAGWPDRARSRIRQGLSWAKELDHIFSRCFALFNTAQVQLWCGDLDEAEHLVTENIRLAREYDLARYRVHGELLQTCIEVQRRGPEAKHALLTEEVSRYRVVGERRVFPLYLGLAADAYGQLGCVDEGLATIEEALRLIETYAGAFWAAEVYRLKGELLLAQEGKNQKAKGKRQKAKIKTSPQPLTPSTQEAEECFLKAIEIACMQQAKSLELRAAMSLARLWQQQGKQHKARKMLSAIYDWFTEGFDTKDLQEARALLDALRG